MSAKKSTTTREIQREARASNVSDFKKLKKGKLLTLPSGLVVTARRVELKTFLAQGDVPNPLIPIVQEALEKGKEFDTSRVMGEDGVDMDMINEMFNMVDHVIIHSLVSPKVHPLPTEDEDGEPLDMDDEEAIEDAKDDELLYVDEVEAEDKMFIFQWVTGGTEDVARFRAEAEADLASMAQGEGKRKSPKRATQS